MEAGSAAGGEARRAVERAARDSYGRLIAFLAARSGDVVAVEDALADAFKAALESWPQGGAPQKPEAWLLTVARRRLIGGARHLRLRQQAALRLRAAAEEAQLAAESMVFPDDRLKLMFVCAHPAIGAAARTPLMLQTVLGLDAARIASASLVRSATMGQRLSRTKAKIRDAGIAFEVPGAKDLPLRLGAVLEAIYAAYGSGWEDVTGADPRRRGLSAEAIELCRLLLRLMPAEPEVQGLLALMLHCEARRKARRSPAGEYVPLAQQDVTLWSRAMIEEADRLLTSAWQAGHIGGFQLEAAIQSAHAQRAVTGQTDWESIAFLYEGLVRLAPTLGALTGRAAAVAEARGAPAGWALLQALPEEAVTSYQPNWALAAHLLERMGRRDEAKAAYGRAIGLCEDEAARMFLARKACGEPGPD